jgi:PIN domain nuclease of toxin-antitoxin system
MLESKGRVTLAMNCMDWVHRAIGATGLTIVPLTPEIAIESSRLPHVFHGDPADRIIVATARNLGAMVATRDKAILEYGKQGNVNVMAV